MSIAIPPKFTDIIERHRPFFTDDDAELKCCECESELEPVKIDERTSNEEEEKAKKRKRLISIFAIIAILAAVGVGLYFIAHFWYICFTLRDKKINWWLLGGLLAAFIAYFFILLVPNISNQGIRIAVMLYILVSCVSVSSAAAMPLSDAMDRTAKTLVIIGISSLLFSDFLISLHDFVGIPTGYFLMLPTFYLSQILVTGAIIHLLKKD